MIDALLRWLLIDDERWERTGPDSLTSAGAVVVVSSGLLAFVRFGGLTFGAPRSFLRLMLVGIWGWILLTAGVTLVAAAVRLVPVARADVPDQLRRALAVVGRSHIPLLALVGVTMFAGFFLQLYGPGLVVAVFVLALWLPAALVTGVRSTAGVGLRAATAIVAGPYVLWYVVIARHQLDQIGHLL